MNRLLFTCADRESGLLAQLLFFSVFASLVAGIFSPAAAPDWWTGAAANNIRGELIEIMQSPSR